MSSELSIHVGYTVINVPFLVCDNLQVDALLDTGFLDINAIHMHLRDKTIEFMNDTEVPILRTMVGAPPTDKLSVDLRNPKTYKQLPSLNNIMVAKHEFLLPISQT